MRPDIARRNSKLIAMAMRTGKVEFVEWLQQMYPCDRSVKSKLITTVKETGNMELLKWLQQRENLDVFECYPLTIIQRVGEILDRGGKTFLTRNRFAVYVQRGNLLRSRQLLLI